MAGSYCARMDLQVMAGITCDTGSLFELGKCQSYDNVIMKLTTICQTNLSDLNNAVPDIHVEQFSVHIVPIPPLETTTNPPIPSDSYGKGRGHQNIAQSFRTVEKHPEFLEELWEACQTEGYHGLKVLAKIDESVMPNNASRKLFTLSDFVNSVMHSIQTYFMFQHPMADYVKRAVTVKLATDDWVSDTDSYYFVLVWKLSKDPDTIVAKMSRPTLHKTQNTSSLVTANQKNNLIPQGTEPKKRGRSKEDIERIVVASKRSRRNFVQDNELLQQESFEQAVAASNTGKTTTKPFDQSQFSHMIPPMFQFCSSPDPIANADISHMSHNFGTAEEDDDLDDDEDDQDITFQQNEPMMVDPCPKNSDHLDRDKIEFGFERSNKGEGRKSTAGRKSLALPDWPEEEQLHIVRFFDMLNPTINETTRVALTCKYSAMQHNRELTSKQLYMWVQKKGRSVHPALSNYAIPEEELKDTVVEFYESLSYHQSETSRVAFTCKFLQAQFGVAFTSKQLYEWLEKKEKKKATPKRC